MDKMKKIVQYEKPVTVRLRSRQIKWLMATAAAACTPISSVVRKLIDAAIGGKS